MQTRFTERKPSSMPILFQKFTILLFIIQWFSVPPRWQHLIQRFYIQNPATLLNLHAKLKFVGIECVTGGFKSY